MMEVAGVVVAEVSVVCLPLPLAERISCLLLVVVLVSSRGEKHLPHHLPVVEAA